MKTLTISVKSGNCCGSTPVAISEINRVRPSRDDLESGESQAILSLIVYHPAEIFFHGRSSVMKC